MSSLGVLGEGNDLNFKWGIVKGRSKNDKDVLYDSFTFNGVKYHLYDCAIFYQEGDLETSIGKLVKLYETPDHERKVKVVWFLRPIEIRNFLGNVKPRWNEIFLSCGEGRGLSNDNSLESVIRKCNVVCTSEDERNPPASEAELNTADYFFYRAFDVGKQRISEKFADKIDGIKVDYFFNGKNHHKLIASNNVRTDVEQTKHSTSPSKIGFDRLNHNGVNDHKLIGLRNDVEERTKYSNSPFKNGLDDHKLTGSNNVKANVEERMKYSIAPSKTGSDKEAHNGVKDGKSQCSLRVVMKESKKRAASEEEQSDIPHKKRKLVQNCEGSTTTQNMAPPEIKDKAVPKLPCTDGVETESKFFEVTRRPDAERRSWFRQSPWEDKLEIARQSGTVVLLENLDPSFTSFEVEDIVWSALQERVEAKMIQRSTFSSPHCGKALVIFKAREIADQVLNQLGNRCLLLADGRPIFAHRKIRAQPGKSGSFTGHLILEKNKFHKQREEMSQRNAVSTSHCSQPNTSEHDLAIEWCMLYEKSDLWWNALHKRQEEEIQNLEKHSKDKSSS